jgi:hypothetical protein
MYASGDGDIDEKIPRGRDGNYKRPYWRMQQEQPWVLCRPK